MSIVRISVVHNAFSCYKSSLCLSFVVNLPCWCVDLHTVSLIIWIEFCSMCCSVYDLNDKNFGFFLLCWLGWTALPAWATEGQMWNFGLSSEYRFRRQCLSQYFARGLETRTDHQLHRLWITISVLGKVIWFTAQQKTNSNCICALIHFN